MKTTLALMLLPLFLAGCGSDDKHRSEALEQVTNRLAQLEARVAQLDGQIRSNNESETNLVSRLGSFCDSRFDQINATMQIDFQKAQSNSVWLAQGVGESQSAQIAVLSKQISALIDSTRANTAAMGKLDVLFDGQQETLKMLSDERSDYLFPIKTKLHAD